jgi:DNA-binding IclR family transcriptional regulator
MDHPIEPAAHAARKHAPGLPRAQSLTRAAALVRAVGAAAADGASTAALARRCELPVATAARLLATLSDEGFVDRTPDGARWTLGLPLVRLARAADPDRALLAAAPPLLEELAAEAGESAALAVARPGPGMDVIAQADAPGLLGVSHWVGRDFPLHASAPGKLVLAGLSRAALRDWVARSRPERFTRRTITTLKGLQAELDRVRAQGFAELEDELEASLASIAVPVPAASGAPLAFVGVSGPTGRLDARRRRALVGSVRAISERLASAVAGDRRGSCDARTAGDVNLDTTGRRS